MNLMLLTFSAASMLQGPDPMLLKIGDPGTVSVEPGAIVRTSTGRKSTIADVAAAADGHRFVFLGESHTTLPHHEMQAAVIEALVQRGRDVIVGFEMFTRPNQPNLNPWTLGWWTESEFIEKADWKGQWGFDFSLYRPIFEAVKKNRLPMVALNAPRDWVRRVGRGGAKALTADEQAQFPSIETNNVNHRSVFNALMGGHPPTGDQGENIYTAQVLWDTAMADSALKFLNSHPTTINTVMVIVAGSGHVMYRQGINYRIQKRTGETGITMVMTENTKPVVVAKGLGDYVYNAQKKP